MARTLIQASINVLLSQGANQGNIDSYTPGNPGNLWPADPVSLNNFTATGRDLLIVYNDDLVAKSASLTNVAVTQVQPPVALLGGLTSSTPIQLLTIQAVNTFVAGQSVTFSGVATAVFLNGQTVQVLTASATQFTAVVSFSTYASAADTGTAASIPATHEFVLHSAPDPQGRQATVGASCGGQYTIAPGKFVQVWIPAAALFAQTDGSVWIDADCAAVQFLLTH